MPSTRARAVIAVGLAVKPVGKPDAGNPHVRFDERGRETGCCRMAQATAPVLDSTMCPRCGDLKAGISVILQGIGRDQWGWRWTVPRVKKAMPLSGSRSTP